MSLMTRLSYPKHVSWEAEDGESFASLGVLLLLFEVKTCWKTVLGRIEWTMIRIPHHPIPLPLARQPAEKAAGRQRRLPLRLPRSRGMVEGSNPKKKGNLPLPWYLSLSIQLPLAAVVQLQACMVGLFHARGRNGTKPQANSVKLEKATEAISSVHE